MTTLPKRKAIVKKAASILRQKRNEFAAYVTLEMGKLFREAQGEVDLSADIVDYYADNAERFLAQEHLKVDAGEAYVESAPQELISRPPKNSSSRQLSDHARRVQTSDLREQTRRKQ